MNIKIRRIIAEDTDNIIKWRNSLDVRKYFIDQNVLTKENHENWLKNYVDKGLVSQFIIECDDIAVGSTFIKNIDKNRLDGEFGIFIGNTNYVKKGVGKQSIKLILAHAFDDLGLKRVYLRVRKDNDLAIKSYEKCGFVKCDEDDIVIFMEIFRG